MLGLNNGEADELHSLRDFLTTGPCSEEETDSSIEDLIASAGVEAGIGMSSGPHGDGVAALSL